MKIENWIIDGVNRLHGITPDGKNLRSSTIVSQGNGSVVTESGSTYELGAMSDAYGAYVLRCMKEQLRAIPETV